MSGLTGRVTGGWERKPAKRDKLLARTRQFRGAHQPSGARFVSPLLTRETTLDLDIPSIIGEELYILIFNETIIRDRISVGHQADATSDR